MSRNGDVKIAEINADIQMFAGNENLHLGHPPPFWILVNTVRFFQDTCNVRVIITVFQNKTRSLDMREISDCVNTDQRLSLF